MTHLKSSSKPDELNNILSNLRKKKITFKIKVCEGIVIMVDTKNKELLTFAKKNNPELK